MTTEKNGIKVNYFGQKTSDSYIAEVKCKEDDNDSNFNELQKICVRLAKYKRYKEDIDRELQSIKHRQIAGLFLFLGQLKQNGIAFATAYPVLEFPFITYCIGVSKINPLKYNFSGQIRERHPNAILGYIHIATNDALLGFFKLSPWIKSIDVYYENTNFSRALIHIFTVKNVRLADFKNLFDLLRNKRINVKKLAQDALSYSQNDVLGLCNKLQEALISCECNDIYSFANIQDNLKHIFADTDGKYLYLEQLIDLYAIVFNCSYQSAYKMWKNYNHTDTYNGYILWQEYEQQIINPEYTAIAQKLKTMQYRNLRCSRVYTLLYAILLHMHIMKLQKRQLKAYAEQK